ncbi:MlaA family lipoprotein [Methylovulum psychrotolerans]|nr:VacJ family lipoprotein [Methylovulum psychrotolerans]
MNGYRTIRRSAAALLPLSYALVGIMALSGCAATATKDGQAAAVSPDDPYEPFNRAMYGFNDTVDNYIAEPISKAYRYITPQFFQDGVFNFFNNVRNVDVITNDLLQGKLQQSGEDSRRLLMNSTLGLGGLFDVAKSVGLEQHDEDFEQTFAVWGMPRGPYWVIPLVGPSTTRGIPAMILDAALTPTSYTAYPVQVAVASLINTRSNAEGALKFIDEAALDPYVFTRESYLQWRESLASDGKNTQGTDLDAELDANDAEASSSPKKPPEKMPAAKAASPAVSSSPRTVAPVAEPKPTAASAPPSFAGTAQSFDATAQAFQGINAKLDRLSKLKNGSAH